MTPHTDTVHRSQMQLKHKKKKKNTFRTMKGLTLPSVHPNGQRILNKERLFESDKRTMDKKEASFPFFPFFFFFFTPQLISLHSHFSLPQQHTPTHIHTMAAAQVRRQTVFFSLPYPFINNTIFTTHSAIPLCTAMHSPLLYYKQKTTVFRPK